MAERVARELAGSAPLLGMSVTACDPAVDVSGSVRAAAVHLVHAAIEEVG